MLKKNRQLFETMKADYEGQILKLKEAMEELTARNRLLEASVSEYKSKEKAISDSLIAVSMERQAMLKEEREKKRREQRSNALLAEKCRALLGELLAKYPEAGDVKEFDAFVTELEETLDGGLSEDEPALTTEEMLKPEKDLASLCRDLGVME